ncbi:MAG TPA: HEPN domain-containing protein [Gemmataceae bacterium]|nr:HEPN domain-containing protein [Gemmataceae bacterium]
MLWSDFQDTADRLVVGQTEGDWRSAVSRTYYAVFHYFREFFLAHGIDVGRSGQSHNSLSTGLLNCGLPSVVPFGRRFDRLRTDRTTADYNFRRPVDRTLARNAVRAGRAIAVVFQTLLGQMPTVQIIAAVRRYLLSIGRIP